MGLRGTVTTSPGVISKGLTDKVTLEQRPEESEGVNCKERAVREEHSRERILHVRALWR